MSRPRKFISQKKRFAILARDGFRCRYCGRTADRVALEVDHVRPVAKGGSDGDENLITSCFDCNIGKSDLDLGPYTDLGYTEAMAGALAVDMVFTYHDQVTIIDLYDVLQLDWTGAEARILRNNMRKNVPVDTIRSLVKMKMVSDC